MREYSEHHSAEWDRRVLILAPLGNDAAVTTRLLSEAAISAAPCRNITELLHEMRLGCAALVLAEEALGEESTQLLSQALHHQPSWSDIPILVITGRGESTEIARQKLSLFGPSGNVTLLERPFRPLTIINAAQVAVRARERQYQVRDLLKERERIHADLERSVELRTAELRETNAQLEELVYSIAHDLRAPLRAMQGFSSLLISQYGDLLPEEGKNYALRVVRSAEAMDAITLDLLAYGRIARSEVKLGPVSVASSWTAAMHQCEKAIEETGAQLHVHKPLPTVLAQHAILTQILANLLSNALKFIEPGQRPHVTFRSEPVAQKIRLWVEDNGIGIPPQYIDRIFRVFERLDGTRYPGTGIGLSIVRKGVERMGGSVGVESQPGRGSRFWIDLAPAPPLTPASK